jgi:hypothetical protein
MARKKKSKIEPKVELLEELDDFGVIEEIEPLPEAEKEPDPDVEPIPLYEKKRWKNVKDVFRCTTCDHFEDYEDNIKLHVLRHVPEEDREKLFERLMR